MSNQVYSNSDSVYPIIETGRYLVDRFDNNRLVIEGPHNIGDLIQLKSIGSGTYTDPDVMKFRSPSEVIVDNLITTKGGLLTNNGVDASELPVGVDRSILQANSATADGIEWTDNVLLTTLEVSNQIKTNNINPIGAGPIIIDGSSLQISSPGNNSTVQAGNTSLSPPTVDGKFFTQGKGDCGLLAQAGEDGTGTAYMECASQTREVAFSLEIDDIDEDLIIETSNLNTLTKNDMIFKVGGQYAVIPASGDRVVPVGGAESMRIIGTTGDVNLINNLTFTNAVQIGDAVTFGVQSTDIIIGKGSVSNTGARSVGIGNNVIADGQDTIALGTNAHTTFTGAVSIGNNSSSIGAVRGYAIGDGASVTAQDAWAIGRNVNNTTPQSVVMFDATYPLALCGSLYYGSTNGIWTNLNAPFVSGENLYQNNAAAYAVSAVVAVNGRINNVYNVGAVTLTFPSRTSIVNQLENFVAGTPTSGATTRHSTFKTTIINNTGQVINLTAGTNQTIVGTSFSVGIGINQIVVFESYLTGTAYVTYRVSTQGV